jgi:hypothetical protein
MSTQTQTQKQYASAYNVLGRITGEDISYIHKHPEKVYELIKGYEYKEGKKYDQKSIKNLVTAILASFKGVDGLIPCELQEYHLRYLNIFRKLKEGVESYYKTNEHNDRKRDGFVAWDEIVKKRDELSKQENGSRRHLLLSMYTYIPPLRQDFNEVRIYRRSPKEDKGNYIVLNTRQQRMVMNEDKTQVSYGRYEVVLPKVLVKVINASLKETPREYLFTDLEGKAYIANSFTKFSNKTLKDLFDNEHISVSLLRSSYISAQDFNKLTEGDKEVLAKQMRHSVSQQGQYRHIVN